MLAKFLKQLFEHGHVQIGPLQEDLDKAERQECVRSLGEFELVRQRDFPGSPPKCFLPCAMWAAEMFYRACQAAAYRDLDEATVRQGLSLSCPECDAASKHYSVDLVFRFLPDLVKLAVGVSPADPLVKVLQDWANQWPLSSVGMANVVPVSLAGIADVPGMLGYYVDRVIARRDVSRLVDPVVRAAVRRALNLYVGQFREFENFFRAADAENPST